MRNRSRCANNRHATIPRTILTTLLHVAAAARPTEGLAGRAAHSRLAIRFAGEGIVRARRLGTTFPLDLADNVQRTLYLTGTYEPGFLRFLQSELASGDVYADIGAHVGIDAVIAARRVGQSGHVYAFEPAPDTVSRLEEVTHMLGNVTIVNAAVGAKSGTVQLRADPSFPIGDLSTRSLFTTGLVICEVPMTTFDIWATELDRLDVIKIDIEGGEHDAVAGMTNTLSRLHPRTIIVEIQPSRIRSDRPSPNDVSHLLHIHGYVESGESFLDNVVFRTHPSG